MYDWKLWPEWLLEYQIYKHLQSAPKKVSWCSEFWGQSKETNFHTYFNRLVNPESSHINFGLISVISVDFSLISVDFSLISVGSSVIPDLPSVSHCTPTPTSLISVIQKNHTHVPVGFPIELSLLQNSKAWPYCKAQAFSYLCRIWSMMRKELFVSKKFIWYFTVCT